MQTKSESSVVTAIEETVLDYFEGWYDADPERMARSLHPMLAKRTLSGGAVKSTTRERMVELTEAGEGRADGLERGLEVSVVDLHADIASVVVRSSVYREYLHLVRADGRWTIVNALWAFS
jgi:hypothetical protein